MRAAVTIGLAGKAAAALGVACAGVPNAAANPEIKDHEIRRFVYLKTNCGLRELKRLNSGERPLRFHVACANASGWPDGMEIACSEPDDDRSCRVTTEEKRFQHLELLKRHGER
jgi:hypothetical protein